MLTPSEAAAMTVKAARIVFSIGNDDIAMPTSRIRLKRTRVAA